MAGESGLGAREAPVVRMRGPGRRPALAAIGGAALVAVIAVADLLAPPWLVFIGLTVLGPLLASLAASWLQTAAVAVFAVVTALLLGLSNAIFLSEDHLIRLVLVGVGGALCVYAASQRERRQAAMSRLAHVAEVAQEVMLRPPPAVLGHVALAGRYVSASDEALVGGDLYETAYTPRGVRVIVGDVRGKGLDGIRLAASVLATFRESVWEGDLTDLARAIDKRLTAETAEEDFVTAVLAEFPPDGGVVLVNGGHLAPLRLRAGRADLLVPAEPSPPFGLDPELRAERYGFSPGDRLLLYTDGLTDSRDSRGTFFPVERHIDVLGLPELQHAVDGLLDRLLAHTGDALPDDLAVLLIERLAAPVPVGGTPMRD